MSESPATRGRRGRNAEGSSTSVRQRLVDRAGRGRLALQTDAARQVGLRVHVDEEHALVRERQRGGEVDGGRGLADAALLVGDGPDTRIHLGQLTNMC